MMISPKKRRTVPGSYILHTALQAVAADISVVPIRADGTKQPSLFGWREYQQHRASKAEVERWFYGRESGIAFITGAVSGNLEALDFDSPIIFDAWLRRIQQDTALASLYDHISWGYLESTPAGGKHLLYRCDTVEGNRALPSTVAAALDEVHSVMKEIEMCQLEGHAPDHHDIPWRVGYLVFCMHHVERVNQRDQSARLLVTQFLDHMGVSLACALEIALVRLRSLNKGEDIVHVDTHMLVPIMKRHLAHCA